MILAIRPEDIVRLLEASRFPLDTERVCQDAIEAEFIRAGLAFSREHRFAPGDIVDFLVGAVALEVKIRGPKRAIFRQCERYCAYADVETLILVTTVVVNLQPLPKPALVVNLGRAWL